MNRSPNPVRATMKAAALIVIIAFPLAAKPAPKEQTPRAVALLTHADTAFSTVHPVRIRIVGGISGKGGRKSPFHCTIVRNDANHSVTTVDAWLGHRMLLQMFYINGAERVSYNSRLKTYMRMPDGTSLGLTPMLMMEGILNSLLHAMSPAQIRNASMIQETTWHGVPVYEVILTNKARKKSRGVSGILATIARVDNLPQQLAFRTADGDHAALTFTYERPAAPYPASTFIFVPPPGAREQTISR